MHHIKIKKGLDIPLEGEASGKVTVDTATSLYGIVPDDFIGYKWKCVVKPGDKVAAGDQLLVDKELGRISLTSPVAGIVEEVRRGERRKILAVTVRKDQPADDAPVKISDKPIVDGEEIRHAMCQSGIWALMRQRPYDIIPSPEVKPRDIFVTSFDSSPLAPALFRKEDKDIIAKGVEALAKLTTGRVYVAFRHDEVLELPDCETIVVDGPHPSGNVGVHIEKIAPVNKGEVVWTMDITTVRRIGRLVSRGEVDYSTEVAVTGPLAHDPHPVLTKIGVALKPILEPFMPKDVADVRVISGNVLTGTKEDPESGFLRYPYRQVTLIKEGAHADEFMGWASISPKKYSVKHTFPAFLRGLAKPFPFDARVKGGHRAMILSGEYDKVFPMDIYPEYLLKAIIAKDIDRMEQLGIYEVAPEDFALPEFVDTSKIELQKLVREGLDYLRNEI